MNVKKDTVGDDMWKWSFKMSLINGEHIIYCCCCNKTSYPQKGSFKGEGTFLTLNGS